MGFFDRIRTAVGLGGHVCTKAVLEPAINAVVQAQAPRTPQIEPLILDLVINHAAEVADRVRRLTPVEQAAFDRARVELVAAGHLQRHALEGPGRPPTDAERYEENMDVVKVLVAGATTGAGIGAGALGPPGAFLGGACGAVVGLIGAWFICKQNEERRH
jgi:hypothetical protein